MPSVERIAAFSDNYLWLAHDGRDALVVDPGDAAPVLDALQRLKLRLRAILVTHHHPDHVGGIARLLSEHAVPVYGPAAEVARVPQIDHPLQHGDRVSLAAPALDFAVLGVPGHTLGHIAYHCAAQRWLFCGDTLFASGCGRLFEGTPEQMHDSLSRLAALPDETLVYCAHEYTASNMAFACAVEPDDAELLAERARITALRQRDEASVPTTIARERRFNPFLRSQVPAVAQAAAQQAGNPLASSTEVFAALRRWKDGFRA